MVVVETMVKNVVDEKRDYHKGVKLRKYTLQEQKEMIQMMNSGARTCDIMRKFNSPESTVAALPTTARLRGPLKKYPTYVHKRKNNLPFSNSFMW